MVTVFIERIKIACWDFIHKDNTYDKMVCVRRVFNRLLYGEEQVVMTIGAGSLIEIVVNMTAMSQQNLNAYQYDVSSSPGPASAVQIAEGWWNHVKATLRAIWPAGYGTPFVSVRIRELNNLTGDYAEFDIPIAERAGTRANPTGEKMPPFNCLGVRLVVGTRATRPGQKRYSILYEGDQADGVLGSAPITAVNALMAVLTAQMTLGAPAALTVLNPIITRKDTAGFVTADQPITGFLVNPNVTSQNTRKIGRGS